MPRRTLSSCHKKSISEHSQNTRPSTSSSAVPCNYSCQHSLRAFGRKGQNHDEINISHDSHSSKTKPSFNTIALRNLSPSSVKTRQNIKTQLMKKDKDLQVTASAIGHHLKSKSPLCFPPSRFRSRLKDHIDLSKNIVEKKRPNSATVAAIRQKCDSHCDPTFENNGYVNAKRIQKINKRPSTCINRKLSSLKYSAAVALRNKEIDENNIATSTFSNQSIRNTPKGADMTKKRRGSSDWIISSTEDNPKNQRCCVVETAPISHQKCRLHYSRYHCSNNCASGGTREGQSKFVAECEKRNNMCTTAATTPVTKDLYEQKRMEAMTRATETRRILQEKVARDRVEEQKSRQAAESARQDKLQEKARRRAEIYAINALCRKAFEEDYARFLGLERGQPKREGNGSVGNRPIMAAVCV